MSHNVYEVESSLTSCKAYFLPTIKPRQRHHGITLLISIVIKIFCIRTLCAWVFFSTLLPWEFIYSYFEKGRKKRARDNPKRYLIWRYDQYTVPDTVAVELTFAAFL